MHLCNTQLHGPLKTRTSLHVLPRRIWSFCVKGCGHNWGMDTPKLGRAVARPMGRGKSDPYKLAHPTRGLPCRI